MHIVLTESKVQAYKEHQVNELSPSITSGGQRVGGINEMASNGVSAEFILFNSGHDAEGISTLWHYIGVTLPMCMPGALVLHGWRAPAYGPGRAARPPSLEPVLGLTVDATQLGDFADAILHLVPTMAPPDFLRADTATGTGLKRRITEMLTASLIMYYPGAKDDHECKEMSITMERSMVRVGLATNVLQADSHLRRWAAEIQHKFDVDNAELTRLGKPYSPRPVPPVEHRDLHAEVGAAHVRPTPLQPLANVEPLACMYRWLR